MTAIMDRWIAIKIWLEHSIGLHNDALHVHVALLILFGAALVLRRRPDHIGPFLVVLILELINEWADLRSDRAGEAELTEALKDLYNTMVWPVLILLFGRLLFPRDVRAKKPDAESSGENAEHTLE